MAVSSCCAYLKGYGKLHHKSTPRLYNYQQVDGISSGFFRKILLIKKTYNFNQKATFCRENE